MADIIGLYIATERLRLLLHDKGEALLSLRYGPEFRPYVEDVLNSLMGLRRSITGKEIEFYSFRDAKMSARSINRCTTITYGFVDLFERAISTNDYGGGGCIKNILKKYARNRLFIFGRPLTPTSFRTLIPYLEEEIDCAKAFAIAMEKNEFGSWIRDLPRIRFNEEDEHELVGLEEEVKLLVGHLASNVGVGVVSICGMRGLGKTTLAAQLYKHPMVRPHFNAFAWLDCTTNDPVRMIRDQLLNMDQEEEEEEEVHSLLDFQIKLRQVLLAKTCLLVLDDIDQISPQVLCTITGAFLPTGSGSPPAGDHSKLILTSTDTGLLRQVKAVPTEGHFIYHLRFLNEGECCDLFQRHAFPRELGKEFMKLSQGLPLAVVTVASYLSHKDTLKEWEKELKDFKSVGSHMRMEIHRYLRKSYNQLPSELLYCFLYLRSIDSEIEVEKLYQLWIAENIISSHDERSELEETMMDVAKRCLNELVLKNLVQVQVDRSTGQFKSCKVHDIMRCLYPRVDSLTNGTGFFDIPQAKGMRIYHRPRLCIRMGDPKDQEEYNPSDSFEPSNVETLLFFLRRYFPRSNISKKVQSHLSVFKHVRVLDLGGLVFSRLDEAIGTLFFLKYLGLRYTVFHALPSSLEKMVSLETLDLWDDNTQYASITVPNVLWKLKQLRSLYLRRLSRPNERTERMLRLHELPLEILENLDLQAFNVEDLFTLENLRRLRAIIHEISDLDRMMDYLRPDASKRLRHLALSIKHCDLYTVTGLQLLTKLFSCEKLFELSIDGRTGRLPRFDENNQLFAKCLTKLTFDNAELREECIGMLEKLPNLLSLFFRWNAFAGKEIVCSSTGFPKLSILQIWRAPNLEVLRVAGKGGMRKLSFLEIISCPKLMVLEGLEFLGNLQELVFRWMPQDFNKRVKRGEDGHEEGEDYHKVKHVRSIQIIS